MDTTSRANGPRRMAESTVEEAYGASQIGPFDYCPRLGFREYWYPAVETRQVRRKPVHLQMLGDDLVLFRDKAGAVVTLSDWCRTAARGCPSASASSRAPSPARITATSSTGLVSAWPA